MADGQPDWLHLVEVDHDPFAGAPVTLQEVDHDPFAQPQAPPMTAQQRYRAAQYGDESRMPSFERTGPSLADIPGRAIAAAREAAPHSPADFVTQQFTNLASVPGQIDEATRAGHHLLMEPPLPPPQGSYTAENGMTYPGTSDPAEWQAFAADQKARVDFGPSVALSMIGGGAPAAERAAAGIAGGKLIQPIRAYHGSPHDFERFDLSKIGTGEGAQAYGHGLYFAENEGVARNYRDQLSRVKTDTGVWHPADVEAALGNDPNGLLAFRYARASGSDWDKGIARIKDDLASASRERRTSLNAALAAAEQLKTQMPMTSAGHMYEVGIRARPEDFLDWDRPLSRQPAPVADALQQLGLRYDAPGMRAHDDALLAALNDQGPTTLPRQPINPTGAEIYRNYAPRESFAIRPSPTETFQPHWSTKFEDALASAGNDPANVRRILRRGPQVSTEVLREAGIPGIRYLDQGSRNLPPPRIENVGGGHAVFWGNDPRPVDTFKTLAEAQDAARQLDTSSRNYVVFDDKLIDILRKYGIVGALGGAGAAGAAGNAPSQPGGI